MADFMWENLFSKDAGKHTTYMALKNNILFSDLNPRELKLVEKIVNVRRYRPSEPIFKQGEVGVGMYIIIDGAVNISVEELDTTSSETRTHHVIQLKAGEFFGELALVENNGRRSASASSQEETTLIGFFKPDLVEIIDRNPTAGVKILMKLGEVLGIRLRETTSRITEMKKEHRR